MTAKLKIASKTTTQYARLNDEVRRLLNFKKSNLRGRNRTPCPECATPVDINANKCPHCASDITEHTGNVRQHLAELDEITAELEQLHASYMECREEEAAMQPFTERVRRVLNEGCQKRPAVRVNALRPKFDEIEKLRKPAMSVNGTKQSFQPEWVYVCFRG